MNDATMIPFILAFTEVAKRLGIPSKYAPVSSIVIGVGLALLFADTVTIEVAIKGIVFGLSASGLWSGGKAITK